MAVFLQGATRLSFLFEKDGSMMAGNLAHGTGGCSTWVLRLLKMQRDDFFRFSRANFSEKTTNLLRHDFLLYFGFDTC